MNSGRLNGAYDPLLIAASVGAMQPLPPSTGTTFSLSWFST
jgi:hypothetical protein